jgi:hypothetical protein
VVPGPLSFEVIAPVVLFCVPSAVAVTFSEMLHELLAATVPPPKLADPEPANAVVVPPHVLLRPLGVATTSPAGKLSLKATPVRPMVFKLVIVNVRLVLVFSVIELAPNVLLMVGGLATVMLAVLVFPVPPFVELTVTELFFTPEVVPVTFTLIAHAPLTATVPVARLTVPVPAVAVVVPPHVLLIPLGVATTSPAGKLSVNATPVSVTVFAAGLVIVKLKLVVPFTGIMAAPNDLLIVGGDATVKVAEAVPPAPPSVELIAVVVLFFTPAVVPVTFTENVHVPLAASVAAERLIELPLAVAEIVPLPQVPVCPFGVDTTKPEGNVSENAMLLRLCVVFGLVMVKLRLVLPFSGIVAAPNDLLIVGGDATVTVAVEVLPVPPFVEVTVTELLFAPAVVPVTFTENVHELLGEVVVSVAPDRLIDPVF